MISNRVPSNVSLPVRVRGRPLARTASLPPVTRQVSGSGFRRDGQRRRCAFLHRASLAADRAALDITKAQSSHICSFP